MGKNIMSNYVVEWKNVSWWKRKHFQTVQTAWLRIQIFIENAKVAGRNVVETFYWSAHKTKMSWTRTMIIRNKVFFVFQVRVWKFSISNLGKMLDIFFFTTSIGVGYALHINRKKSSTIIPSRDRHVDINYFHKF